LIVPSRDHHRAFVRVPPPVHEGLDHHLHSLVGRSKRHPAASLMYWRQAKQILERSDKLHLLAQHDLDEVRSQLQTEFRAQSGKSKTLVKEALAVTTTMARRYLGLTPHPCQIMGALAMHEGYVIEMATGEGKSLTASLVGPLAGWTGRPCHVVTVNDYLASRDAKEMAIYYSACGTTVGCVTGEMEPPERRENHSRSVVYTTSQQLLADFLRDRLRMGTLQHPQQRLVRHAIEHRPHGAEGLVLRGLHFALVDEADSVLVDEAVTPLIISKTSDNRPLIEATDAAVRIASQLELDTHYEISSRYREIKITNAGFRKIEQESHNLGGVWRGSPRRTELITQALMARDLYQQGKHYVIQDGKVVIVDEFTGRLMPDRNWSHGLHQAVEAKEGVEVTSPTETMARLSFQRFFRLFDRLCGMSGTIEESAPELWHIYELPTMPIPTHQPCRRDEMRDRVFRDQKGKVAAIIDDVVRQQASGRPVLVGTRSVLASEEIAAALEQRGIPVSVLNAVRHREEAAIIAQAGESGRVTIATNMAGRGTDIKLGSGVSERGGLHVIATERNESRRIDRQLFGRCARQGDPGSSQAYVCPSDELIKRFILPTFASSLEKALTLGLPGSGILTRLTMRRAQNSAQRMSYKRRQQVLMTDEWLEEALSFATRKGL